MAKNAFSQLASLGEEVLGKAAHNPTAARVLQGAVQLKDRVDDLSKRVRGLEQMEKRLPNRPTESCRGDCPWDVTARAPAIRAMSWGLSLGHDSAGAGPSGHVVGTVPGT